MRISDWSSDVCSSDLMAATADLATYPDPAAAALREGIAAQYGLAPARVIYGTGPDELLHLAAIDYAGPGDEVLYVRYGFSVYDIAARRVGATPGIAPERGDAADIDRTVAGVNTGQGGVSTSKTQQ